MARERNTSDSQFELNALVISLIILSVFLSVSFIILFGFYIHQTGRVITKLHGKNETEQCDVCQKTTPKNECVQPHRLYEPLTDKEMKHVHSKLLQTGAIERGNMGLPNGTIYEHINTMSLKPPDKTAAKNFLAGIGPFPGRFAEVHVIGGTIHNPVLTIYSVGPLANDLLNMESKRLYKQNFDGRREDVVVNAEMDKFMSPIMTRLSRLTQDSFDGAFFPGGGLTLRYAPINQSELSFGSRFSVHFTGLNFEHDYFDVLPFSGALYTSNSTFVIALYYLDQGPFNSAESLLAEYDMNTIRNIALPSGYRKKVLGRLFPSRDISIPVRDRSNINPSRTYEPAGARYSIQCNTVRWLGWSFEVSNNVMRGPVLFNIKFNGDSIAYEIGLDEIMATFYSDTFSENGLFFYQSGFDIGAYPDSIFGVDCPEHATLLTTYHWEAHTERPVASKSMCVFEQDGENSVWQHNSPTFSAGLRNNFLVIRASSHVNNHDYSIDFRFFLDGKIEILAHKLGYLQGSYWDEFRSHHSGPDDRDSAFGYRIVDHVNGIINQHFFGFKVDLDIVDSENKFHEIKWKKGDTTQALRSNNYVKELPPYLIQKSSKYITWKSYIKETGIKINSGKPAFWVVVKDDTSLDMMKRGYQIIPSTVATEIDADADVEEAASFTKYNIATTLRKETEMHMTPTAGGDGNYLDRFLDMEDIRNKDLVHWVTVGLLHVPTKEDFPAITRMTTGFVLKPFNFFDRTSVFDLPQYTDSATVNERPPEFKPCLERKDDGNPP